MIGISRIALGLHSWNQVLVGILVSIIVILILDRDSFYSFLDKTTEKKKTLLIGSIIFMIIEFILAFAFFFINKGTTRYKEDRWHEVAECEDCFLKFMSDQMEGMAHSFMTAGFFFGYALNVRYNVEGVKIKEKLSLCDHLLRLLIYVVCGIPALAFFLGYEIFKSGFSNYDDKAVFKYFMFITYGFLTGFFTTFLAPYMFCKFGKGMERDFIGFRSQGRRDIKQKVNRDEED